ncbi:hybrid sensor histidine kinase/response regulator transcription factor [Jejuia pallidilutea]|uniref:histidine kinase n=1 Tax=Jejuia pallidilutea TaxID=504487 RepID=A0A090VVQ1_9FLAO|nr:two-component regulator propeller domain-containing protein [Jejuia pallidilutea]GAL68018.1 DNA-binding response regulator [Jejuia pallidilutea]GAL90239.1 DNA-binding response regulator [Jejuia pallidilutea]
MLKHLAFLLFFSINYVCYCQTQPYQFSHLSTVDGLSQSAVIAIHQDKLGQIWIGTRDGLNKYDGTKFTIYRNEEGNPNSISNNDILSIHEDQDGFLWIGTYNGLNKYNPRTDTFTRFFHNQDNTSLSNNTIWIVKTLSNGQVWVGTSEGLSVYNKTTNAFSNYLNTSGRPISKRVMSILETKTGAVFVGTGAGIYKTSIGLPVLEFNFIEGSEAFYVQDLIAGMHNNILIATRSKSVLNYSIATNAFSAYLKENNIDENSKNVRQLLFDDNGTLWVGTYNGLKIVHKNKKIVNLQADIDNKNGLSKNSIKSLFKDKKGSVWIGTYYGGINIWDETNVNFINITQNQKGKGLNYSVVSSIENYKDIIFFGTEGGGVNVWNKQNNTYNYINQNNSQLTDNNIKSLKIVDGSLLWIGTFGNGLAVYNAETNKFETQKILSKTLIDTLSNTGVYAIKNDNFHNVWIGTFGQGLFKFNINSKKYQRIHSAHGSGNNLSSNLVRAICIDSNNNVWVGTEKGLNKIEENGAISSFFYDEKVQYGDDILCIYEDVFKNLWVGTKSKGLYKYNNSGFEAVNLSVGGIRIPSVHSILEDNKGQLWISTNQGIIKYNSELKEIQLYNQTDGLISNEFNVNASLRLKDSQFFFGSPEGVTYINASSLKTNTYTPQVILTELNIKENNDKKNNKKKVLEQTLPFTESIKLSHNQGNFSISFSIPNFINSSNNKYKYRLKGLENDWNLTTANTASYTIQNPGDYTFQVKGANNDNVWNSEITQLNIYVAPAPWRTWWAFTIYALLILGALYFLLNILKSKTKLKHELELEHLEIERTKEINKTKLEFFTNISHEFRTPLALILGPLQQIIEDYRGSSKIYKKLLIIENSANHLLKLINRLMDFRKFENNLYKLEAAEGNIVKFLKEIYLSFTEYAENGGYDFNFICDEDQILVYYDRYKLERVFYNLISNAFRYTPKGGKITMRVKQHKNNITISVEDTGVGIAEEYQDKIFERFFEVAVNNKPDNNYNKGTGIGLSIAKNIIELHKGDIKVTNNTNNQGSVFTVSLPLGKAHLNDTEILDDFKFSDDITQYVEQLENTEMNIEDDIDDVAEDHKSKILLVEDNKQLRKFIKGLLEKNYNIIEAENGKVAFKKAITETPDLVISDVIMPEMTGTELCSALKEELKTSHIPVILLTSRSSLIYKLDGLEKGADDYISKPFDIKEFVLRVNNVLQTRETFRKRFADNDALKPEDVLVSSFDEKLYKKAIKIVKDNIGNEQFDIPFFCSELGVSRTMLFTKIKAWSTFTPNEFIMHFRMKRAAQLLEQGKMNISQISYKVGFKNPKYFSKCFQKQFGKTPSQYADKFST